MHNNTTVPVPKTIIPAPPVHPLSSFVTIVLDWLWTVLEVPATITIAAVLPIIAASGISCFVSVLLIQRYVARDGWMASIAKGLVMGITAGVPYPVVGTAFGGVLLGWAGIHGIERVIKKSRSQNNHSRTTSSSSE